MLVGIVFIVGVLVFASGCELLSRDQGRVWQIDNNCHATEAINLTCRTSINRDESVEFGYGTVADEADVVTTRKPDGSIVREVELKPAPLSTKQEKEDLQ